MTPNQQPEATSPPAPENGLPALADWAKNPIYVQSEQAFRRALPELLKRHHRKWAAYHGDECLGIAPTQTELWERCTGRGLKPGEFTVRFISEGALDDTDELGWMTVDFERYKFDPE
ncbi:MAG TPA: hypothetical protein VKA46_06605 [Gemmataceae bacterium]|nr:hypothetical protein [Gemmataceae bacterium]